jgi:hypothetical protein
LLFIPDAKDVMKKLSKKLLCLLTKPQPYQRPRSPMAARGAIHAGRGTSPIMERDAGSHSVDRVVRIIIKLV